MNKQVEKPLVNWWRSWPQEMRAFGASIIFLLIGLLALLMAKFALKVDQDAVLVTILLVPVFIYLILSGQLKEIRGPGGLRAIFNDVAHRPSLEIRQKESMDVADMVELQRSGPTAITRKLYELSKVRKHIVLTVTLKNQREYYVPNLIVGYLQILLEYQSFRFLVILDESQRVFAYISGWRAMEIIKLESEIQGQNLSFVTAINAGDKSILRGYELIEKTARSSDSNEDILTKMMEARSDALIVTYDDGRLKGVVEREQILSELMLAAQGESVIPIGNCRVYVEDEQARAFLNDLLSLAGRFRPQPVSSNGHVVSSM